LRSRDGIEPPSGSDAKEPSDKIAAALAYETRKVGLYAMCLLALAILVGVAIILLMAR
jgi:hypothetical protein